MKYIDMIAGDNSVISYRPKLNEITGSITATILLQQIMFRFKNRGNKPFYKFKDKCDHELYIEGDSWFEELGMTRRQFDRSIKKIGIKISSANKKQNHDKFVEYYTDINRLTWYQINEKNLDIALKNLYESNVQNEQNHNVQNVLFKEGKKYISDSSKSTLDYTEIYSETCNKESLYKYKDKDFNKNLSCVSDSDNFSSDKSSPSEIYKSKKTTRKDLSKQVAGPPLEIIKIWNEQENLTSHRINGRPFRNAAAAIERALNSGYDPERIKESIRIYDKLLGNEKYLTLNKLTPGHKVSLAEFISGYSAHTKKVMREKKTKKQFEGTWLDLIYHSKDYAAVEQIFKRPQKEIKYINTYNELTTNISGLYDRPLTAAEEEKINDSSEKFVDYFKKLNYDDYGLFLNCAFDLCSKRSNIVLGPTLFGQEWFHMATLKEFQKRRENI